MSSIYSLTSLGAVPLDDRARRLLHVYEMSQRHGWIPDRVIDEAITRYGGVAIEPQYIVPLGRIISVVLWGEWIGVTVSAQLTERLQSLDLKAAAASQTYDEVRHTLALHRYLRELGVEPQPAPPRTKALLNEILETRTPAEKLLGMQLTVELIALTLFSMLRERRVEPVLCDLLSYMERDEARHVGLGVQGIPAAVIALSFPRRLLLLLFHARLMLLAFRAVGELQADLRVLGIDAREILEVASARMSATSKAIFSNSAIQPTRARAGLSRLARALASLSLAPHGISTRARLKQGWMELVRDFDSKGTAEPVEGAEQSHLQGLDGSP